MTPITAQDLLPELGGYDDFSGKIVDAWFESPEQYTAKAGSAVVHLKCLVDAEGFEEPVSLGGFSCGSADKWEIGKEGKELIPQKGKPKFNAKSNAGIFVDALFKVAGEGDAGVGANKLIPRGFLTTQAEFYIGLESHWVKKAFKNPTDPTREITIQLPTEYVNIPEAGAAPAPTVKKESVKAAAKSVATVAPEDLQKLKDLASGKDDKTFKKAVLADAGFKINKALMNEIFSNDLIKKLEDSGELVKDPTGKYV